MVIGEHSRDTDLELNITKGKQLTNMRKSGTDEAEKIAPKVNFHWKKLWSTSKKMST